jgi:hypothetical protein
VFPPGYIPYRNDRKTDAHGGLFILVSKKYLSSDPEETSEQLWIKFQIKGSHDLYIGSFYKPPKLTDEEYLTHLEKKSNTCSSVINKIEVIPGISDHEIVYIEANLKPRKVVKPPRKVFLYNNANTEKNQ